MNTRGKLLVLIVVLIIVLGGYLYIARPVAAPSVDVASGINGLDTNTSATLYSISQAESKVAFTINEVLRGEPFTVVGTTDQVAGEISINTEDPSLSEVSTIRVNARTLKTDSQNRDGAISRLILKSEDDANEFIEFTPVSIDGMPEEIVVGEEFTFQVTGDLTVSGATKRVTFNASAELGESTLTGHAETTVNYKDFNLSIPEVAFVASVEDEVVLSIDFVAELVDES